MNEHGYRITWAKNRYGIWFNAYDRDGHHIEASYDRDKCTTACEKHAAKKVAIHVEQTT